MKVHFNQLNRPHSKKKVKDPDSRAESRADSFAPLQSPFPSRWKDTLLPLADYDPISISHSRGHLPNFAEGDSVDTVVIAHTTSPRADQDTAGRSSRKIDSGSLTTTNGSNDVSNKFAFLSPPPTLSGLNVGRLFPEDASTSNNSVVVRTQSSRPKDPHGYMSTAASAPRPDFGSSKRSTQTVEATLTNSVTSYSAKPAATIHQSLHFATPFSQKSIGSVLPTGSWSEGVEEDLVTHLGSHERTRQEVLWEIVANEERYGIYPCFINKNKPVNCLADMSPSCSR